MENEARWKDEQDQILVKSPLLKKFVDPKTPDEDDSWKEAVDIELEKIKDEMHAKLGNFEAFIIWPQFFIADDFGAFPDGSEVEDNFETFVDLAVMGYELGSIVRCDAFLDQITNKLLDSGSVVDIEEVPDELGDDYEDEEVDYGMALGA